MFLAIRKYQSTESNPYWKAGSPIENPMHSVTRTELLEFPTEDTFEKWLQSTIDLDKYTLYRAESLNIRKIVTYDY